MPGGSGELGGLGGVATGIYVLNCDSVEFTNNQIRNLSGGQGGSGLYDGSAGNGGTSSGILLDILGTGSNKDNHFSKNKISNFLSYRH